MNKKPVIGITLDFVNDNEKYLYSKKPWYALRKCYADAVLEAGGFPVMIPYSDNTEQILNMIDGLIIPGGDEDVNPRFYGQEIKSDKVKINDIRASFDLQLAAQAMAMDLPLLGICNGLQVINVACGGTLIQHIPDYIQSNINHEQPEPKCAPTHSIIIAENTMLGKIAPKNKVMVNTTHHQAVEQVGRKLIVSARAEDGIIEAVESEDHNFVVGVQWHCEYRNSELDYNLFKRLVAESIK